MSTYLWSGLLIVAAFLVLRDSRILHRERDDPPDPVRADLELLLAEWHPDEGTALRWSLEWCARNHDRTYR